MIHTELVWKVARYTSAGPIYFSSMDNYVDGGILANNPSASGLTEIQDFYRRRGQKLPISLIVSIGGGRPPSDIDLGDVNAHEYLSLGKHWWNFKEHFFERLGNLTTLLGCAVRIWLRVKKNILSHLLSPPRWVNLKTLLITLLAVARSRALTTIDSAPSWTRLYRWERQISMICLRWF